MISLHEKIRPLDQAVCAVASSKTEPLLYTEFDDSLFSSVDADHVSYYKDHRKIIKQSFRNPRTLSSILEEQEAPSRFDLLCVDVEGHDLEVLDSLDFNRYRPRIICVEIHGFTLDRPNESGVYTFLVGKGYELIGYLAWNGYFRDAVPHLDEA